MGSTIGPETVLECNGCGASVYREHIDRGLAGRWAGQLLCPHCMAEKRNPAPAPAPAEADPLAKADEAPSGAGSPAGKSSSYAGFAGLSDFDTFPFQRPLLPSPRGATRMRIFHCKLSDGPLIQLNRVVNEWLDMHNDIEVKFATTTIGTWEGRHSEQQYILTLYY